MSRPYVPVERNSAYYEPDKRWRAGLMRRADSDQPTVRDARDDRAAQLRKASITPDNRPWLDNRYQEARTSAEDLKTELHGSFELEKERSARRVANSATFSPSMQTPLRAEQASIMDNFNYTSHRGGGPSGHHGFTGDINRVGEGRSNRHGLSERSFPLLHSSSESMGCDNPPVPPIHAPYPSYTRNGVPHSPNSSPRNTPATSNAVDGRKVFAVKERIEKHQRVASDTIQSIQKGITTNNSNRTERDSEPDERWKDETGKAIDSASESLLLGLNDVDGVSLAFKHEWKEIMGRILALKMKEFAHKLEEERKTRRIVNDELKHHNSHRPPIPPSVGTARSSRAESTAQLIPGSASDGNRSDPSARWLSRELERQRSSNPSQQTHTSTLSLSSDSASWSNNSKAKAHEKVVTEGGRGVLIHGQVETDSVDVEWPGMREKEERSLRSGHDVKKKTSRDPYVITTTVNRPSDTEVKPSTQLPRFERSATENVMPAIQIATPTVIPPLPTMTDDIRFVGSRSPTSPRIINPRVTIEEIEDTESNSNYLPDDGPILDLTSNLIHTVNVAVNYQEPWKGATHAESDASSRTLFGRDSAPLKNHTMKEMQATDMHIGSSTNSRAQPDSGHTIWIPPSIAPRNLREVLALHGSVSVRGGASSGIK